MDKMLSSFGLTNTQARILFSLEGYMCTYDAEKSKSDLDSVHLFKDKAKKKVRLKLCWCKEYRTSITNFLIEKTVMEGTQVPSLCDTTEQICTAIALECKKSENEIWKYLILLECTLFQPYFPLNENEDEIQSLKGLQIEDRTRKEILEKIAKWLDINYNFVKQIQNSFEKTVKTMNGYWKKVFIGVGAGIVASVLAIATWGGSIAAMFAASGLYGAAAISSGLAALGGGAIAAGGFGMAGGIAVLVGGAALFGTGAGGTISMMIASTNPEGVMMEAAKLYVVLKEIILGLDHDTKRALEVIEGVIDKISDYKKEIARLKAEAEENKKQIKNLEKSIKYLESFLKMASL